MKTKFLRRLFALLLVTALVTGVGVPMAVAASASGYAATHGHAVEGTMACDPVQALGGGCKNCAPCVMLSCDAMAITAAPSVESPPPDLTVKVGDETPDIHSYTCFNLPRGPPQRSL